MESRLAMACTCMACCKTLSGDAKERRPLSGQPYNALFEIRVLKLVRLSSNRDSLYLGLHSELCVQGMSL